MYEGGKGGGTGTVVGATSTVAGAIVLPNTGESRILMVVALTSIVIGVALVVTTIARSVAKKSFKA